MAIGSVELIRSLTTGQTGGSSSSPVVAGPNPNFIQVQRTFTLEAGYYILSLEYTAKVGAVLGVYWNKVKIFTVAAQDLEIHTLKITLQVSGGDNTLEIAGESINDLAGVTVKNVEVTKSMSIPSSIGNGQDSNLTVVGQPPSNSATGPSANSIKVRQTFNLDSGSYILSLEYAAKAGAVTSSMGIYWNGVKIFTLTAQDSVARTLRITIQVSAGVNTLEIATEDPNDTLGLAISNV